jgi:uncharacterized protein YggL (DUF469 family)
VKLRRPRRRPHAARRRVYFILTDESAKAVSQTATSSMRRFSQSRKRKDDNLFSLVSAVFLARRGDADALKLLNSLLDHRNIDSLLDTEYVIHAAAMSGNEKLMQKIRDVVATDKRVHWNGEDCMPRETSFAHVAASACSLAIEGFPSVMHWGEYDEETKKKVRDWLEKNPASKIKSDIRPFFNGTPFQRTITAMWRQFTNEQNSKKP